MPSALVLYHYYYPDDVVSATHLTQLCEGLAQRGWSVTAMPCNRGCRNEALLHASFERHNSVTIRRLWRPQLRQATKIGRLFNSLWMIARWASAAFTLRSPDVLIIGTDPVLSVCVAPLWKRLHPKTKIIHWCFDLYPEAAIADGLLKADTTFNRALTFALQHAYQACDLIADLGPCMRHRLRGYRSTARRVTLTPWALEEPEKPAAIDCSERRELFGDAVLGLMYSGNFGRAHSFELILKAISLLGEAGAKLAFSVRGNSQDLLRSAVHDSGLKIRFVDFASPEHMLKRLSAADIHVISLRPEWTGTVVPSKFFGAIAIGRPVLFEGSRDSAVAQWIERYKLGWVLSAENVREVASDIAALAGDPRRQSELQAHCHEMYRRHFSSSLVIDAFDSEMSALLEPPADPVRGPELASNLGKRAA